MAVVQYVASHFSVGAGQLDLSKNSYGNVLILIGS
jgi:hypothetical protein